MIENTSDLRQANATVNTVVGRFKKSMINRESIKINRLESYDFRTTPRERNPRERKQNRWRINFNLVSLKRGQTNFLNVGVKPTCLYPRSDPQ